MNVDLRAWYHVDICAGSGMLGEGVKLALGGNVRTVAYVERESYAAAALVARMEDEAMDSAPIWDDVKSMCDPEFLDYVCQFRPLVVTAGYPCQPVSFAGKRLGEDDERYIWPWIAAFLEQSRAELFVGENVPGHLTLGFDRVYADLRAMGRRVEAGVFSAEEVGASHQRKRLFVLAELADALGPYSAVYNATSPRHDGTWQWSATVGESGKCVPCTGRQTVADAEDVNGGSKLESGKQERRRCGSTGDCPAVVHAECAERRACESGGYVADGDDAGRREASGGSGEPGANVADAAVERGAWVGLPVQPGESRQADRDVDGTGVELAESAGGGCGVVRQSSGCDGQSGGRGGVVADAGAAGFQGCERGWSSGDWDGPEAHGPASEFRIPLFAPGPGDAGRWAVILDETPDIAPATERELCRTPDGVAYRLDADRLRLTGNGVVALAAAYAVVVLGSRFAVG